MSAALLLFTPMPCPGQEEGRIPVPATRVSIVPPPCYRLIPKSTVFYCDSTDVLLTIVESQRAAEEVFLNYSDSSNLAELDFEEMSRPEETTIDGVAAMKFNLRKRKGLLATHTDIFRVVAAGDSFGTITAIISYSDTVASQTVEPLARAIATIQWDHGKKLRPGDVLGFDLSPPSTVRLAASEARWELFTPDGVLPADDVFPQQHFAVNLLAFPGDLKFIEEEARKKQMEIIISRAHPQIKVEEVVEFKQLVLDGLDAFESVSRGKWKPTGRIVAVYCAVLFHPGDFIRIVGFSEGGDDEIQSFRSATETFRRREIGPEAESECGSLMKARSYDAAAECFDTILRLKPASLSARLGKAEALRSLREYDAAIVEFGLVLREARFSERALLGRARSYAAKEQWVEALRDFDVALDLNCLNASGFLERAAVRKKVEGSVGAEKDYRRALSLMPDSSALYVALAEVQSLDEAILTYTKAIGLNRANMVAYKGRAMRYLISRRYGEAVSDLSRAIALDARDPECYAMRASAYLALDKRDLALADMSKGPTDPDFLRTRGFQYGLAGKTKEALSDFSKSIASDSTAWMAYFLRGIVLYLEGSFREACVDLRRAAARSANAEIRAWLFFAETRAHSKPAALKNLELYYATGASETEDWHQIIRYLLGQIDETRLLSSLKPFKGEGWRRSEKERMDEAKCDTYFAIGMTKLMSGLNVGAKTYWNRCLETTSTDLVSYAIAFTLKERGGPARADRE